ncbi:hypothetical protein [Streptomyces sp. Je 1-332]|uniref:hypothetical protein n=1 Tax=Streptomyces sp. Je 1-332 TaxID=3231270 RepID=UPI003457B5AD
MKISKAAAGVASVASAVGVAGVGLALGAVAPAIAAPQPQPQPQAQPSADGVTRVLDSATRTTQDVQDLLGEAAVDPTTGELTANNPGAVTTKAGDAALGAVSMLGGLPAGAPVG